MLLDFYAGDLERYGALAGTNRNDEIRRAAPPRCGSPGKRLPPPWVLQVLADTGSTWRPWQPVPDHVEALMAAEAALEDWEEGYTVSPAR
eukprot:3350600-Alexandrium_andersonii.AAC.1